MKCEPSRGRIEYAFSYLRMDLDIDRCIFDERDIDRLLEKINLAGRAKQNFKF